MRHFLRRLYARVVQMNAVFPVLATAIDAEIQSPYFIKFVNGDWQVWKRETPWCVGYKTGKAALDAMRKLQGGE